MTCLGCDLIKDGKAIYEDDHVMAFLKEKPASSGHVVVMPKQHFTILEQIPDEEIGHIFEVANRISSSLFESLKIQGTNIIVQNGLAAGQIVSHFMVNIIPRAENDGLNFDWEGKKLSEEDMSAAEVKLREAAKHKVDEISKETPVEIKDETEFLEEDNYLVKHLRKIP